MKKMSAVHFLTMGMALAIFTGSAFASPAGTVAGSLSSSKQLVAWENQEPSKKTFVNQELLTLLQMDAKTLKQEWKAGKSLSEIAAAKGVQKQQVIDLLVKQATDRLNQKVKSGKLTQEQAEQIKTRLQEKIKLRVDQKGGFGKDKHSGHHGPQRSIGEVSKVLGVEKQELLTQLKAGKSILEIAQSKGITKEELISKLLEKHKENLSRMIEQKWQQK